MSSPIIGVSPEMSERWVGHLPVTYDAQGALAGRYGVATMPTTVLFDRNGKQRFVHKGYFPNKQGEYGAHVAALVAEHP